MMGLDGKVVLITGASSGIGEVTARRLVEAGGRVVLGARRADRLETLRDELGSDAVAFHATDVTVDEQVRTLVDLAGSAFGRLDAVFANAGFGGGGTIATGEPDVWREMLLTNVYGAAITIRYAIDALMAAPEPHVVLTSSVAGRVVPANRNHMYAASKFAVEAIGDGLRKELTGRVRVTLIEPGAVDTEFADWPGTVLSAEDVARAVVFALGQPAGVAVNQIMLRPLTQEM
jgi:NADP-dependent 3-hydroxy acid dehydrogenase YdfG